MPAPRAFTATSASVKDIADKALNEPEGVTLTWTTDRLSLEACAHNARSFQCTFSALRARARRMKLKFVEESADNLDLVTQGPYDRLACVKEPLMNRGGWSVSLLPAEQLLSGAVITNAGTGAPLKGESPSEKRKLALLMKAQKFPRDVTQEEFDWLTGELPGWYLVELEDPHSHWFKLDPSQTQSAASVYREKPLPSLENMFGPRDK